MFSVSPENHRLLEYQSLLLFFFKNHFKTGGKLYKSVQCAVLVINSSCHYKHLCCSEGYIHMSSTHSILRETNDQILVLSTGHQPWQPWFIGIRFVVHHKQQRFGNHSRHIGKSIVFSSNPLSI